MPTRQVGIIGLEARVSDFTGGARSLGTWARRHSSAVNTSDGTRSPSTSYNSLAKCRTLLNPNICSWCQLYLQSIRLFLACLAEIKVGWNNFPVTVLSLCARSWETLYWAP